MRCWQQFGHETPVGKWPVLNHQRLICSWQASPRAMAAQETLIKQKAETSPANRWSVTGCRFQEQETSAWRALLSPRLDFELTLSYCT